MLMCKKKKWLCGILLAVVIISVVLVVSQIAIVLLAKSHSSRNEDLLKNGPWSMEGVWKNSEEIFYLVSLHNESEIFTEVTAYIHVNGLWKVLSAHIRSGTNTVSFLDSDGNTQITAKALLNDDGSLTLSQVQYSEDFEGVTTAEWQLIGYSWEEQGEQLPFKVNPVQ